MNKEYKIFKRIILYFLLLSTACAFKTHTNMPETKYVHIQQNYVANVCNILLSKCRPQNAETYGSGFLVAHRKAQGKSYIMTAAHVCRTGPDEDEIPPFFTVDISNEKLKISDFEGEDAGKGTVIAMDERSDLCLIEIPYINKTPIPIARRSPKRKDIVLNVGSPWGFRTHEHNHTNDNHEETDSKPFIFEGYFNGYQDIIVNGKPVDYGVYVLDGMPGQSGSPILNKYGRLIGVVSRSVPPNYKIVLGTTLDDIVIFLDKHLLS